MVNNNQNKAQQAAKYQNVLESLKSIETNVKDTVKEEVVKGFQHDVKNQIFGSSVTSSEAMSGTIEVGGSVNISEMLSGERESLEKQKQKVFIEKRIIDEERIKVEQKTNQLRLQLKVIMDEVVVLSQSTQELGEEVQIAAMQAPIEPGIYHVLYFEKLLDFVRSFRKKIQNASTWLHASNKRAEKKNYWTQYKKHGAKLLLSGESYSSRSAG